TTGIPLLGVSALSWTERDFADGAVATLGAGLPISLTPTLDTLLRNLTPTAPGTWPIPRTV
ncbi:MAG: hypothetical protein H7338_06230, partial [Candidatus Sericytochromatia bacterium]|nr:hypothetical protein [Candidatus Sericytochromatia bacterium]